MYCVLPYMGDRGRGAIGAVFDLNGLSGLLIVYYLTLTRDPVYAWCL